MKREQFVKAVEETQSLLIITGTMGAGKTTVLGEASDILALRQIAHAAIDLDARGLAHLPSAASNDGVMVARAMEDSIELELCRGAVSATNTIVCRLTASIEAMQQRVKMRESGVLQRQYVARVAKLNVILDRARLEDFTVTSESRSLTDVAHEMLVKAGWISN